MQAQNNKYDTLWKKTDGLISKKGLSKSALTEVEKIYALAKKEGRDAQMIKALVYKMQLNEELSEEAQKGSIQLLDKEIRTAAEPVKSILTSLLAERYYQYFQQHRYQLYSRTQTQNFRKDDIATWGITDFHAKTGALYLASIQNEKLLQQTGLQSYDAIIVKGNMRTLRPTLYDLLAHKALDYFQSDERDINKPAYAFELKDESLFSDATTFIKLKLTTPDSLSLHHKALLIFRELLQFHAGDTKPDALIDADLLRIQFVHQYAVMENKDELYTAALRRVTEKWRDAPATAQAWYLLAQMYAERAGRYEPFNDTTTRYDYQEAVKICERVLQQNAESEGKTNCFNLLRGIQRRELNLTAETVNIPGQPFRTLVQYRNFTQLYFRIISLTDALKNRNEYDDAYWKQLVAAKSIRSWSQALPATGDYQKHSTEVKIDALPVGGYVLVSSPNENFSFEKNPVVAQHVYVSNISYVNRDNDYFLLHRETGKPLAEASVQVWHRQYDYNARRYTLTKGEKKLSNKNGFVQLTAQQKRPEGVQLEVTYHSDHLFGETDQYIIYNKEEAKEADAAGYENKQARLFFFTDRSIYRPGQTLYFKGIAITKDFTSRRSKAYPGHKTRVNLYNANGEKVDSLGLTTNAFGSYSGKFRLPEGGLTGEFYIEEDDFEGQVRFSVEEYKRPKFYVEYETIKEIYKVNDSIAVTGFARAYAGNNIDGAQVKYRVVRQPRFIYPWLYRGWFPRSSSMEIANGVATTDAAGKFILHFKAIPDLTISKQTDPVFDYQVSADVTDINGETRSGEKTVPVSYKALQIKIITPAQEEKMPADSLGSLLITTQNINGEFQSSLVRVSIYRLQAPGRLIRERYWQQPDQFVMNREEFIKDFLHDEYEHESDFHTWNKGEKVWEGSDSTQVNKPLSIRNTSFTQGSYLIEAVTTDKWGEEVKDVRFVQLYDEKSSALSTPSYSWNVQKGKVTEPGETSTVIIGSSASDLFVIQQIDSSRDEEPLSGTLQPVANNYRFISLSNEKKSFDFTAAEQDRGGFGVYHFFVKNNRFYSTSNIISVPWTNKELSISYESFRDKTLPRSEEKWKVKIGGYKNEKVAAEMLASLYDASLDQFKPHGWNSPDVWPTYVDYIEWDGKGSFGSVQSWEKYYDEEYKSYVKSYDQLLAPNFRTLVMIRGMASKSPAPVGYVKTFSAARTQADAKSEDIFKKLPGVQVDKDGVVMDEAVHNKFTLPYTITPEADGSEAVQNSAALHIQPRKNFQETAFFLPDLKTDAAGNIEFSFTIPEALTRWKFQTLAHTKEAAFGYSTRDVVTQKQLMVQPNAPRFLREGDHIELSTKVVNLTDKELTGTVHLELLNAATMQPVDGWFQNMTANQYFTVEAGKSVPASFTVQVPYQYNSALVYRFTASSTADKATVSDGEEASLPVLKNSILVTESVPLPMRGNAAKNFRFDKLLQSGNSETLQHFALTVEYTGNPVWYAVQSLPYLADYPYECAEQTFNRFYANALASKIAGASPRMKAVFDQWNRTTQPGQDSAAALLSNLQKNAELKSVLLEETPWVLQAKSEAQQKKNIALLFDMDRMSRELQSTIAKLQQFQLPNGGFPWFRGDRDDRFITQYIITGIGHLKKLGAWPRNDSARLATLVQPAIQYLDKRMAEDYQQILKSKASLSLQHLQSTQIQYLYMRSFFPEYGIPGESFVAVNFFRKQSQQYWLQQNRFGQGMIALALNRTGDLKTAQDIIRSLQQNAIVNEEMGMYWKEVRPGYYWYQAPVETQSLLIEAFSEIGKNEQVVSDLTTWLLKQKQTQNWRTTKATADACYALLLQSPSAQKGASLDLLNNEPVVEIKLGDKSVKSTDQKEEAGTGYFKKTFEAPFITASMGDISVKVQSQTSAKTGPSWGAVYWQYFENLDKITQSATALQVNKKLFMEVSSDRGPVLQPVGDNAILHPGTKIKVRIELRVDRDMEYVHLKDMRASCMEPVNVLSSYKWQGGLGYYESTRDASTNFFISRLPKGTYVFEYPLFVTHTGNFSNGITTIQCMYAPEFTGHSEGVRVNVE